MNKIGIGCEPTDLLVDDFTYVWFYSFVRVFHYHHLLRSEDLDTAVAAERSST